MDVSSTNAGCVVRKGRKARKSRSNQSAPRKRSAARRLSVCKSMFKFCHSLVQFLVDRLSAVVRRILKLTISVSWPPPKAKTNRRPRSEACVEENDRLNQPNSEGSAASKNQAAVGKTVVIQAEVHAIQEDDRKSTENTTTVDYVVPEGIFFIAAEHEVNPESDDETDPGRTLVVNLPVPENYKKNPELPAEASETVSKHDEDNLNDFVLNDNYFDDSWGLHSSELFPDAHPAAGSAKTASSNVLAELNILDQADRNMNDFNFSNNFLEDKRVEVLVDTGMQS